MEMNQYLSMFIDESKDHLQAMNDNLLRLENEPENIDIVQEIFRSAHTLKGMAATMGFEDLASLTHKMENVLDAVRNHQLSMSSPIFDALFKSFDYLEAMVNDIIEGGQGQADVSELVAVLERIASGDIAGATGSGGAAQAAAGQAGADGTDLDEYQFSILQQSLETGFNVMFIKVAIREDCVLKAARAYMVFDSLEKQGEVVQSSPSVQDIEQEKFDRSFTVYYITKEKEQAIREAIENVSEVESVEVSLIGKDELGKLFDNRRNAGDKRPPAAAAARQAGAEAAKGAAQTAATRTAATASRTIRVDIERLDTLMNLFSELLIDRVRLESLAAEIDRPELTETVEHMARVSSDLQNIVLKLRMVPVESVFNRFPRMVRDLAKTLNKKVELIVTGAETELDRTVIDEIGDPLVHLLRNSLDHGIEPEQDRLRAGKPETGTIHLRAYHSGNHVFIEIEDDGRGINREKVLNKALSNQLLTPEEAEKLSDEEVYQLLFASGFSTAEQVSDVSGRGVGLDVVKTKITSLGGHVHVESQPGIGTKFSVQLPLTLSIIGSMLIRVCDEKYAMPLSSIVETAILQEDQIRHVHGKPMIEFRDSVIPLIYLDQLLDCKRTEEDRRKEFELVIVRKGERMAAIVVDELIGQQEIVLKPIGKYLTNLFAVSGATILGDGQVALILDTNAMIK